MKIDIPVIVCIQIIDGFLVTIYLDFPSLTTRRVEQLCRSRRRSADTTDLLTGQHGGLTGPAGLTIVRLVFWP